jgi:hypothetical protein
MSAATISQHVSRPRAIRTGGPRPNPSRQNDQWSNVQWPQRGFETLKAPPIPTQRGDNPGSITSADAQQQRLLDGCAGPATSLSPSLSCTLTGIALPAVVVTELELNGYLIERVYDHGRMVGVRLL